MTWRHPTRSTQVGSLLHRSPIAYAIFYLIVELFRQMAATKADAPSLSLSLLIRSILRPKQWDNVLPTCYDPASPLLDVSPNVDTEYLLIVVFLKRTAAIKVEALPTSLIFDGCHSGAPNKGTGAGERKPDGSRPAHTRKGTAA